jgi:hypothetical protein
MVTLSEDEHRAACTEYALRHARLPLWYKAWWFLIRPFWKPVVAGCALGLAHFMLNVYTAYPRIPPYDKIAKWDQHVTDGEKVQKANEDRDREMKADIVSIKSDVAATKAQVGWMYDREKAREARASAMMSGPAEVASSGGRAR